MEYINELIMLGKVMAKKSRNLHKIIDRAPEGTIQICREGDKLKIYQLVKADGKYIRIGIKNKPETIKALARKVYYSEQVERLDKNIAILRKAVTKMDALDDNIIMECMPANYRLLDQTYLSNWLPAGMHPVFNDSIAPADYTLYIPEKDMPLWGEKPYRANGFAAENIQNRTEEGFAVRSKNELSIFNCYKRLDIPTHYDELMRFNGVLKSPDFVSLREDGKVIYHEHVGLVNNPEYMRRHKEKMQIYESCGIVPYRNLIITYENEDGGINMKLIEAQIRAMHNL